MPKRYLTGGGKNPKNQEKSSGCLYKFLNITTNFIKKIIEELKRKLSGRSSLIPPAGASCRGSILIEFAICMPILIILLFYIHDLVKIKRYYSQTEFVAQQMANILQNIAKTKEVDRYDIKRAASLAYLTIYPGTTMYKKDSGFEFFHMPRVYMHYVEGESGGKASCKWCCWINTNTTRSDRWGTGSLTGNGQCVTRWGTNVDQSSIYPALKVEEGRAKIILEVQMAWADYSRPNGEKAGSARKAFGCYLVNPKLHATNTYFPAVVIFSPNSGFTKTVPQI